MLLLRLNLSEFLNALIFGFSCWSNWEVQICKEALLAITLILAHSRGHLSDVLGIAYSFVGVPYLRCFMNHFWLVSLLSIILKRQAIQ